MKWIATCVLALAGSACGSTVPMTGSPLAGWEQVWLDTDEGTRTKMCGTFHGDVELSSGEVGAEALWEALESEDYVIALGYADWYEFMEARCGPVPSDG